MRQATCSDGFVAPEPECRAFLSHSSLVVLMKERDRRLVPAEMKVTLPKGPWQPNRHGRWYEHLTWQDEVAEARTLIVPKRRQG